MTLCLLARVAFKYLCLHIWAIRIIILFPASIVISLVNPNKIAAHLTASLGLNFAVQ